MLKKLVHLFVLGLGAYAWSHADLYAPSALSAAVFPLIAAFAAVYAFVLLWAWIYRRSARAGLGRGRGDGMDGGGGCWDGSADSGCAGDGGGGCD